MLLDSPSESIILFIRSLLISLTGRESNNLVLRLYNLRIYEQAEKQGKWEYKNAFCF